jgi:hypothetical protein
MLLSHPASTVVDIGASFPGSRRSRRSKERGTMPTEAARHRLYERIKEQWGQDNADELMSYLPLVGWVDIATQQDLENVALRLESRIDRGLVSHTRWTVGAMVATTGIFGLLVNWLG